MDFEKTNRWLTLVANIGVVVGIVILAIEVNQNSDLLKQNSALSTAQGVLESNATMDNSCRILAQNPVMTQLIKNGHDAPEELTEIERAQFSHWLRADLNAAEAVWFYFERGLIPEEDLGGYENAFCGRVTTKGGRQWWKDSSNYCAEGFVRQIKVWCFE